MQDTMETIKLSSAAQNWKLDRVLLIVDPSKYDHHHDMLLTPLKMEPHQQPAAAESNMLIDSFSFPIETVVETRKLEESLGDEHFRDELVERVIKSVGKNDGIVDGHYLNRAANQIFTNELLSQYTFKGISRNGLQKENFGMLKNVLAFFHCMLSTVCPIFDEQRTEKYIQTKLLRHAGSRIKRL